jgi:predicted AlkP superfamily pyrophosphatase or phosphodiesterase
MTKVVFVMMDGLRPDAIAAAPMPNVLSLCERGACTLTASSIMPSITLPCHMSIFHSVPPTRHGVTTNIWTPMARPLPGLIDYANGHGRRCASIYSWEPLRNVSQPESLVFSFYRKHDGSGVSSDERVIQAAMGFISADHPDFVFVYFDGPDLAGHRFGWMSEGYLEELRHSDQLFGQFLETLSHDDYLLLQADHGGHDRTHGTDLPEDMTIPWVIAGPNIRQGVVIQQAVSLLDTAPTLTRLLQLEPYREWEGHVVEEIFVS